jgi:hypothetical protein
MPLVRIALRRGKSSAYLVALRSGIYEAMRDAFNVPENDRFILVSQQTPRSSTTTRPTSASRAATNW